MSAAERFLPSAGRPAAEDDEARLVRAAQERPEAFGALYQRHVDAIYRYLQLRVGIPDAADLTQQVFLRALASLAKYESRGLPFSAWLFRIARNLAADHHRSRGRTTDELLPDLAAPTGSPEAAALQTEMYRHLRVLLGGLNPEQKELLAMRFGARLSSREIGAVFGKSEAAVKKQLTRILQRIKENYVEP